MSPPIEFRNMENYYPTSPTVLVVPMLLIENLEKKQLIIEVKTYFSADDFNTDRNNNFKPLSERAIFEGEQYDSVINLFSNEFGLLNSTAKTAAEFLQNDHLRFIKIDSEENIVEVKGERIINGLVDLSGDPSKTWGISQNKFDLLKQQYPDLVRMFYFLVFSIFSQKSGLNKKFYQAVLDKFLEE